MSIGTPQRRGVLAAGNFIVDHVNIVEAYPEQDELALVLSQSNSNGGGPYNLLHALAALGARFPLQAKGMIGNDADGQWILDDCNEHGICTKGLGLSPDIGTSWTDVMSVVSSGRRTFFHYPGANAELSLGDVDFSATDARVFYLGYLTMLETLDRFAADGRTLASHALQRASAAGMVTAADLVSRPHPDFRTIVTSSAPWLDYLFLNELEAGWLLQRELSAVSHDLTALVEPARAVLGLGVRNAVILHCQRGAVCVARESPAILQPALGLPHNRIKSGLGAGDAFAGGFLFGLHEGCDTETSLLYAVSAAASCIMSETASSGIRRIEDCVALSREFGFVSDA